MGSDRRDGARGGMALAPREGWREPKDEEQALWEAVEEGDAARAGEIAGGRPELARTLNARGETPFLRAIGLENEELAWALLPSSDLSATRRNGVGALALAASKGWARMCERLMRECDPLARDGMGFTALMRAANHESAECLLALLPGSDPKAVSSDGWSALHLAARYGRRACARALLPFSEIEARVRVGEADRNAEEIARASHEPELAEEIRAFALAQRERRALGAAVEARPAGPGAGARL